MNWYRVTFAVDGKAIRPVEVPAHDAGDALQVAAIKAGLCKYDDGHVSVADFDCIDTPPRVLAEQARETAARAASWDAVEKMMAVEGEPETQVVDRTVRP